MGMGFVSAILGELSFDEVVEFAAAEGFDCVEMMCWPQGKAERRYAGVTHVDVNELSGTQIASLQATLQKHRVAISSLGYYPNPLDPDAEKRAVYSAHLKQLIDASALLGINLVTTFIGRDKNKSVDDNWASFLEVWTPLIAYAEKQKVRVAIENCPMLFTKDEWPGGLNLATSPAIWKRLFDAIPSPYFGLNYDPSHLVWQGMDYLRPLKEFKERIFHVHYKDVAVDRERRDRVGVLSPPLDFMAPKIPGHGDIDWGAFASALNDIGYRGAACIEVEDKAFEDSLANRKRATVLSKKYLEQYV